MGWLRDIAVLGVVTGLALSCANPTPAPQAPTGRHDDAAPAVRCNWVPVQPDTEERCSPLTKGTQVQVTLRESMRKKDATTQVATCECD
jgi:hypothetical protein